MLVRPDCDLDELRDRLAGRVSVLVGHSGVGKSTLVNRLVPDALRAVGVVSAIGKGRHTSTSAVALRLPRVAEPTGTRAGSWTPRGSAASGWRTSRADSLLHGFPDLVEGTVDCPPNCDHTGRPRCDCALDALGRRRQGRPAPAGLVPPAAGLPGRRGRDPRRTAGAQLPPAAPCESQVNARPTSAPERRAARANRDWPKGREVGWVDWSSVRHGRLRRRSRPRPSARRHRRLPSRWPGSGRSTCGSRRSRT